MSLLVVLLLQSNPDYYRRRHNRFHKHNFLYYLLSARAYLQSCSSVKNLWAEESNISPAIELSNLEASTVTITGLFISHITDNWCYAWTCLAIPFWNCALSLTALWSRNFLTGELDGSGCPFLLPSLMVEVALSIQPVSDAPWWPIWSYVLKVICLLLLLILTWGHVSSEFRERGRERERNTD